MKQIAQRSCGCFITGSVRVQFGWGLEQPGLVKDFPVHGKGLGLDNL